MGIYPFAGRQLFTNFIQFRFDKRAGSWICALFWKRKRLNWFVLGTILTFETSRNTIWCAHLGIDCWVRAVHTIHAFVFRDKYHDRSSSFLHNNFVYQKTKIWIQSPRSTFVRNIATIVVRRNASWIHKHTKYSKFSPNNKSQMRQMNARKQINSVQTLVQSATKFSIERIDERKTDKMNRKQVKTFCWCQSTYTHCRTEFHAYKVQWILFSWFGMW